MTTRIRKCALLWLYAFSLGIMTSMQSASLAAAAPATSAHTVAPSLVPLAKTHPAAATNAFTASRSMSQVEMTETVGGSWWSAIWDGVSKIIVPVAEAVVWFAAVAIVVEFCSFDQVTCLW